ncbi:DUF2304 domain-containing protein [Scrofimicrobium sp. R131]|uniref:DUF2304 domain-containing protein n=1 Tax=Scrofimicrobium appendicitidis TaxID=3079930 RepID=A0AAU7V805_9ACTO
MSYWLIKTILIIGLVVVTYFMMRPIKSANHLALRRLGVMLIVVAAGFAVVFPDVINRLAWLIGVTSGVNLLVYVLFLVVFTQMATGYRRDSANDRKLTLLARALALESAPKPPTGLSDPHGSTHRSNDAPSGAPDESDRAH